MSIRVGSIASSFSNIFTFELFSWVQVDFFNIELIVLEIGWEFNFINDELSEKLLGNWNSDEFLDSVNGSSDLIVKIWARVINDNVVWVTAPGLDEVLVDLDGSWDILITGSVVLKSVELLSSISSGNEMDDDIVSLVSEVDWVPTTVIEDSLPGGIIHIGSWVHDTSIVENNGLLSIEDSQFVEIIFKIHLGLHQ